MLSHFLTLLLGSSGSIHKAHSFSALHQFRKTNASTPHAYASTLGREKYAWALQLVKDNAQALLHLYIKARGQDSYIKVFGCHPHRGLTD